MNIYEKLLSCSEDDVFDLVTSDPDLETDGPWGIIERLKENFPELESLHSIVDEGERIKAIDKAIKGETVLFVSPSNGTDDLLFKIEKFTEVERNIKLYGFAYAVNYIPVSMLPNLWRTPGNMLDAAIEEYARTAVRGEKFGIRNLLKSFNELEAYVLKHWWLFTLGLVLFLSFVLIRR
ncbi:hypothetical protein [Teredinibacter waterburyi]|jgi:hypothetical protein|uniref:hypothetical protein n=1 Tax=Teredinibacter waterburyi TaxID=1500538 RepID=UPI00165F101D|nr:hypothetical protein [Teredinibacter waterburyi]